MEGDAALDERPSPLWTQTAWCRIASQQTGGRIARGMHAAMSTKPVDKPADSGDAIGFHALCRKAEATMAKF
ncbi:hypothetical protein [Lysobacter sp. Hz 25]|uniref:hypothetical protein n=1 Tax=Lysobacter sp. Hz 25 TaxID=3383698 RepID=UPI0038D416F4